jgi:hypothetical protein
MEKMQRITTEATHNGIEEIINPKIYELQPDFWEQIREPYIAEIQGVLQ